MCKELENELLAGQRAALALVAHVESMGAGRLEMPVQGSGATVWKVTVEPLVHPSKK
jgi:hypothetical protein